MLRWWWVRLREGARWLFRGSQFRKLELEIDIMARPLAAGGANEKKARVLRKRIRHAISWLPENRAAKFHDMMARVGHDVKEGR